MWGFNLGFWGRLGGLVFVWRFVSCRANETMVVHFAVPFFASVINLLKGSVSCNRWSVMAIRAVSLALSVIEWPICQRFACSTVCQTEKVSRMLPSAFWFWSDTDSVVRVVSNFGCDHVWRQMRESTV